MQRVIFCLFVILVGGSFPPSAAADSHDINARFERFKGDRRQILDNLIVPVEQCVRRRDTNHVAFHGCIDWHSSVHGTWALVKYTGLTGDNRYASLIHKILEPEKVNAEREFLQRNPTFERPYGRAWFLRLALDHKAVFDSDLLQQPGDFVAYSLMDYYRQSPPQPYSASYDNASWALINLYDYSVSRQDQSAMEFVRELVRQHFVPVTKPCPVQNEEAKWPDFLSVCTTWAYLVAHAAPPPDLLEWLGRFFPQGVVIRPITHPLGIHHMGTNFSRSWALWRLFKATGEPLYLRLYLDHFELQYKNPSWWKGDYRAVAHWVAQFGVFALAPVFAE